MNYRLSMKTVLTTLILIYNQFIAKLVILSKDILFILN